MQTIIVVYVLECYTGVSFFFLSRFYLGHDCQTSKIVVSTTSASWVKHYQVYHSVDIGDGICRGYYTCDLVFLLHCCYSPLSCDMQSALYLHFVFLSTHCLGSTWFPGCLFSIPRACIPSCMLIGFYFFLLKYLGGVDAPECYKAGICTWCLYLTDMQVSFIVTSISFLGLSPRE